MGDVDGVSWASERARYRGEGGDGGDGGFAWGGGDAGWGGEPGEADEPGEVVGEGGVVLDERTSTSFALASLPGQVLLAWTGSDYRINTLLSSDGVSFGGKRTLPHHSSKEVNEYNHIGDDDGFGGSSTSTDPLAPTLTVAGLGRFMAWTGTDGRLNVWGADIPEPSHRVLPERSNEPPALAPWRDELALAWTGTDRRLNVVWTQDDEFGEPLTLDETSKHGPALAGVDDELALAWTGSDHRLNVLVTDGGSFGWPRVLDETSWKAPSLATVGGELVIGWAGTDFRLNVMVLRPDVEGVPVTLDASSGTSPALCALDDDLLVGWTGTDRRLNLTRVPLRQLTP